jgi:hypothetical protein
MDPEALELEVIGEIWYWRGPAPHHFVTVPPDAAAQLRVVSPLVSYGWGMIPVRVTLGRSTFETSLFPKDGGYVVPLKTTVRDAERLAPGDTVTMQLRIRR